jgi:hypothetical protein
MAETIKQTNVAFKVDVLIGEAEKSINKFNGSAESMGKSVEKANKKTEESTKKASKEVKGLTSLFDKLPGSIGRTAKQLKDYASTLGEVKTAVTATTVATNGFTKAVRVLSVALKSSGILLAVTAISALASGLSRSQGLVDGFTSNVAGLGNSFEKLGDNILAFARGEIGFTDIFSGIQDTFKETVRLEQLSNQLKDKRIAFLEKEAELEVKVATLKRDSEGAELTAFQRIIATQDVIDARAKLFEERIKLAKEEVEIRQQLIDLTGNLRAEDEELAQLKANLARLEAQSIEQSIESTNRLSQARVALKKEIDDNAKAVLELSKTFEDLSNTELETYINSLDDARAELVKLIESGDKFQNDILSLPDDLQQQFADFTGSVLPADFLTNFDKIIDNLKEEARLQTQLNAINLNSDLSLKKLNNERLNERQKELAVLDVQITSLKEQIRIEEELALVRQVNSLEDITRLAAKKEELKTLEAQRKLSFSEFLFGEGVTGEEIAKNLLEITSSIDSVLQQRAAFLDGVISDQERFVNKLISLSEFGAEENLKIEQERLNTLLDEREKFVKRQQQLAAIEIAINQALAASEAIKNIASQSNPILIALQVAALAAGIVAATVSVSNAFSDLPVFYEGTEDTGKGGRVDNKGGFKAVLHPNERVVPEKYNKALQGIKNYELPMAAQAYKAIPTVFDFMGNLDTNLNKGFEGVERQIEKLGEQIGGMRVETRMDRKGFANYLMGSNAFKKLSR